ncbi:MAG: SGNH/GDSL hydrolase family protein [Thermoanaerobaculia bacterium]
MEQGGRRRRSLRWLGVCWLALCAVAIGLTAGEVWLRYRWHAGEEAAQRFARPNAFLQNQGLGVSTGLWLVRQESYKPNASVVFEVEGVLHEVRINSRGFRTREFDVPKPEDVYRIACIGASTTFQGLTTDTTYPAILESRLRAEFPDRELEVLDLGVSGTQSDYWLERFDRLLEIQPDLVVQYNGVNDLIREHAGAWAAAHPGAAWLRRESLLWNAWIPLPGRQYEPFLERTRERFAALDHLLVSHGIDHVVGTVAAPDLLAPSNGKRAYLDRVTREWSGGALGDYRQYADLVALHNEGLLRWVQASGVPCARPDRAVRQPSLYTDICHMQPAGIERLAGAFFDTVAARLRLRWRDPTGSAIDAAETAP